jgi:hypothetical protein
MATALIIIGSNSGGPEQRDFDNEDSIKADSNESR